MRRAAAGEEGMALLVVMVLMGIMMTAGVALASRVDTQTDASQAQRVRDSAFNLAESALNSQIFALSTGFASAGSAYAPCPQAQPTPRCPDNASLLAGASPDLADATWQTAVRDNGPTEADKNFYSEAAQAASPQPGYDANGDGKVWVRAQGVAQGRTRTLVALVRSDKQEEVIPRAALIAGKLDHSNSGNKGLLVNGDGIVAVRCDVQTDPNATCLGHPESFTSKYEKLPEQITGLPPTDQYVPNPPAEPTSPAMDEASRLRLKATAMATDSYYPTCPTEEQLAGPPGVRPEGRVVYVENANCTDSFKGNYNVAPQLPGMLIFNKGSIEFGANARFHGVVYAVNAPPALSTAVVTVSGTARITGGVLIDGPGTMVLGASKENLVYDVNAFTAVASFGSAGIVQNTFREIRAG